MNILSPELRNFRNFGTFPGVPGTPTRLIRPVLHRELPLMPPQTGRIAVKVINHYGDEVLKVYEVE